MLRRPWKQIWTVHINKWQQMQHIRRVQQLQISVTPDIIGAKGKHKS